MIDHVGKRIQLRYNDPIAFIEYNIGTKKYKTLLGCLKMTTGSIRFPVI